MKKIHRALALIMAIAVICCLPIQASAANEAAAVIDYSKTASLSLYKYDLTSAEADGAGDTDAYVSTGIYDQNVNDAMSSYAVQGVEFMFLRVADISLYTLDSDAHVYSYGIDMTKKFSDGAGSFENVKFILRNDTDGYYVTARLLGGVYYVTGHVAAESQATVFVPGSDGKVILRGLEDDTYVATELETDEGYNLLKSSITVVISAVEGEACPNCHRPLLTASATVNDKAVEMKEDNGSVHAAVPFTVINTKGFELPKTGSYGTWMFTVCGVLAMGAAAFILFKLSRKKKFM